MNERPFYCATCHTALPAPTSRELHCPICGKDLSGCVTLSVSAYAEEEWAATIRYAEAHASEISLRDRAASEQATPVVAPRSRSPLAQNIFDMCNAINRAYVAQLRKEAP